MTQYFYFLTIPGNESLLKEEMRIYKKELKFSYSKRGFCTFKNEGPPLTLIELAHQDFIFALSWGQNLERISLDEVTSCYEKYKTQDKTSFVFFQLESVQSETPWPVDQPQANNPSSDVTTMIDFIRTSSNEVFVGHRVLDRWKSPFMRQFHSLRQDLISRAYYKVADAFSMFNIKEKTRILELGCVPGGMSQFLLEQGHQVLGLDPAQANEQILAHKNFKFIQQSVQDFRPQSDSLITIMLSDMNLSPKLVLRECLRIVKKLPSLKYTLITIKISNIKMIPDFPIYKEYLEDMGHDQIHFVQLPYHRSECLAFATRSRGRQ